MAKFHVHGGLKRGTAIALATCFLLGSSITSLAAGDGVANVYRGLAKATSVRTGDTDNEGPDLAEHARAYDLDPARVTIMDDEIMPYGATWHIVWTIPAGETYMSSGFKKYEDDRVSVSMAGTPDDVDYEFGLKDPDAIMWYVEGVGISGHTFTIRQDGRHYFYVTNYSETEELHVDVTIYK